MRTQSPMMIVRAWQEKASEALNRSKDRLITAVTKGFDAMAAVLTKDSDPEEVQCSLAYLSFERSLALQYDKAKDDPLREVVYGLLESLHASLREWTEERNQKKETRDISTQIEETTAPFPDASHPTIAADNFSTVATFTRPIPKVKREEPIESQEVNDDNQNEVRDSLDEQLPLEDDEVPTGDVIANVTGPTQTEMKEEQLASQEFRQDSQIVSQDSMPNDIQLADGVISNVVHNPNTGRGSMVAEVDSSNDSTAIFNDTNGIARSETGGNVQDNSMAHDLNEGEEAVETTNHNLKGSSKTVEVKKKTRSGKSLENSEGKDEPVKKKKRRSKSVKKVGNTDSSTSVPPSTVSTATLKTMLDTVLSGDDATLDAATSAALPTAIAAAVAASSRGLECEICDKAQRCVKNYERHLQSKHRQLMPVSSAADAEIAQRTYIECSECSVSFWTKEGVERHLLFVHGLVTPALQEKAKKKEDGGRCKLCSKRHKFDMLQHLTGDHRMKLRKMKKT